MVYGSILGLFWEAFGRFWHNFFDAIFRWILACLPGSPKVKLTGGSMTLASVFGARGGVGEGDSYLIPHSHCAPGKQGLADMYIQKDKIYSEYGLP